MTPTSNAVGSAGGRWFDFGLSFLQVFGASLGLGLLLQLGVTRLTLVVVVLTGLCTTASVLLFGGRHARRQSAPQRRR